jgi:hypothetical protein
LKGSVEEVRHRPLDVSVGGTQCAEDLGDVGLRDDEETGESTTRAGEQPPPPTTTTTTTAAATTTTTQQQQPTRAISQPAIATNATRSPRPLGTHGRNTEQRYPHDNNNNTRTAAL